MENLFISMWNQLQVFANENDFKNYGALLNTIIELIKQLLKRNLIKLTVNDDYNIVVFGIETHLTTKHVL